MGIRLHEASKKYNLSNKEVAQILGTMGFEVKAHQFSAVSEEMLSALEKHFAKKSSKSGKPGVSTEEKAKAKPEKKSESKVKAKTSPREEKKSGKSEHPARTTSDKSEVKHKPEKKKSPKVRIESEEEIEVNKQITIIKTAPPKKEISTAKKKKGKNKRAHFSKKVQAEMREAERQTEAVLDKRGKAMPQKEEETELPKLTVPKDITVSQLAKYLDIDAVAIVKKLFSLGVVASLNQRLEDEHIQLMGQEFGKDINFSEDVIEIENTPDKEADLKLRSPVVTIMGHVDHGKTSLLDYIRKAHVADREVGGITQHIGAYQVKTKDGIVTFIDTPGHEAFTAMRAQGALVTDIAVLVVAADDGVQPQTIEAIHHAQAASVPIIVAINKTDKPDANPEKIKQQLMSLNLVAEDWGGQTTIVQVSAKTGKGINELLEMILLQAEIMELKANPNRPAQGIIIEARLDKGMGPMATALIQNGKIRMSDNIICGASFGRVKALINDSGKRVKEAGPSEPVAILGLNDVPKVGDRMAVVESAKFARYVGELRQKKAREERLSRENRMKLVDIFKRVAEGQAKDLNIILKADVQGSCGALKDALERLSTDEVKVNVIHTGVGGITEADVNLASASDAIIIGFHVRPISGVEDAAKKEDVDIKIFKIIYDAIDAVKSALRGLYDPEYEEEVLGRAEVRKVYRVSGVGSICGSYVTNGIVTRNASVRIVRDGVDVYEGKVKSLKRFKDDVREVNNGYECGISIENYNDIKEGDVLEFFIMKEIEREI
jgi:translation initiation factor IF-2